MIIFKYRSTEYIVNDMLSSSVFRPRPCYDESASECSVPLKMDEDETSTSFFDKISSFSIVLFFVISYLTYYFLFVVKVSERAPIGFLSQIFTYTVRLPYHYTLIQVQTICWFSYIAWNSYKATQNSLIFSLVWML